VNLELDDIQSGVLRPRPTPFAATYVLIRIDDRAAGRALMRRLSEIVASAAHPESPASDTWVSASLTFAGLKSLGVPQASLESFSPQFREGMAARARQLHDVGENAPEHWEKPLGTGEVHLVLTGISKDAADLEKAVGRAREAYQNVAGITAIWRQDCYALPTETEPFGFKESSIEAGRVRYGISRRVRRRRAGPSTGDPGPERQLHRLSEAVPAGR
jgi:deferrochelatase/peroxidase EfeB